jgi:5-formyltetrahydrofolate cyclo-ligase
MRDAEHTSRPSTGWAEQKRTLRQHYQQIRSQLTLDARRAAEVSIALHLVGLFHEFREQGKVHKRSVALYRAHRGEVDVMDAADALRRESWKTGFPVTHPETRTIAFREADERTSWVKGAYGIWEPVSTQPWMADGELFAVVVPGLAFTKDGGRLGYGGGYYDRLFERLSGDVLRIGVAYAAQLADWLPLQAHDVRMHFVVTEEGVVSCGLAVSY